MIFDLYRIKILEPTSQSGLFDGDFSRSDLLRSMVTSNLQRELRQRQTWMLGNIESIDSEAYYMRIGRRTRRSIADYVDGNFVDKEYDNSPYTHIILDVALEIAAIARQTNLSATTKTIANSLIKLLSQAQINMTQNIDFEISAVPDPSAFINALESAYAVRRFSFTFSRPNPFPYDKLIQEPLQEVMKQVDGENGKLDISGSDLDKDKLQDVTHVVASNGNEATALIVPQKDAKPVSKKLSADCSSIDHPEIEKSSDLKALLKEIRRKYNQVQGKDGEKK